MFAHIFKYRIKTVINRKDTVFWAMVFPLLLATLFKLAFSGLGAHENFSPIKMALVPGNDAQLELTIEALSEGESRLLDLQKTNVDEAKALLSEGNINAYLIASEAPELYVRENGMAQSIMKIILDRYLQMKQAAMKISKANPEGIGKLIEDIQKDVVYTKEVSLSSSKPDMIVNYFYSLLAMACLFGGFYGLTEVNEVQANLSDRAARLNTSPVHKLKTFVYAMSASVLVQFMALLVLLLYMMFALKIDFGNKIPYIVLALFVSNITGIFLGAFVSSLVKGSENVKTAILITFTMIGNFLSGMQYQGIKYLIQTKAPILQYLHPASLMTDAFYSLYYYDTYTRFFRNISGLLIYSAVFCLVTYAILRRRRYASI